MGAKPVSGAGGTRDPAPEPAPELVAETYEGVVNHV